MQSVTNHWLHAQNNYLLDECFVEVIVTFNDPDASYTASVSADSELESLSDVTTIFRETQIQKYGTLEENLWILDGSVYWTDEENHGNAGYISNAMTDENNIFLNAPVIQIIPEQPESNIYGVTIVFSELFDEYAIDFALKFYYKNEEVASTFVTGNTLTVCPVEITADNYDRLEITISKWCLPYKRARIEHLVMGYQRKFEKRELLSFSVDENVNLLNASLPENTLNFTIDFTKESDTDILQYFRKGQKIKAKMGMYVKNSGKEMINGGIYYLDAWNIQQDGLKGDFTAKSVIYFLNQTYTEGIYSPDGISLYDLAEHVLTSAKRNSRYEFDYKLSDSLKKISTTAPLPVCTYAECLQYIAQAGSCTLLCDREGTIKILTTSYSDTNTQYVIKDDSRLTVLLDYPKLQLQTELSHITATVYDYSMKVSEVLYHAVHYIDESAEIVISHTMSGNVSGTVTPYLASEDIQIVSEEYFASCSRLTITGKGYCVVEITGQPLEFNTSEYRVNFFDTGNAETISNPLITSYTIAKSCCESAVRWLQNRNQQTISYRADPRIDAGDIAIYQDKKILVSQITYDFTGMFRGEMTGRVGYEAFTQPDENEAGCNNNQIWPDINDDGSADAADASIIMQASADIGTTGESGLTAEQEIRADANRDGLINSEDAVLVLTFSALCGTGDYQQSPAEWNRFLRDQKIIS